MSARGVLAVAAAGVVAWSVVGCTAEAGQEQVAGCHADPDCAAGARCLTGTCQYPYLLALAKPAGRLVTNGVVEIQVSATGGPVGGPVWQPESVELFAGQKSLATVGPPGYATTWSPGAAEDGTYQLRARVTAGGQVYESLAVEVVVDHQPPAAPELDGVATPRNTAAVALSGRGEANATVRVHDGGAELARAVVTAGGTWAVAQPVTLGEGAHALTATATDEAGNGSVASAGLAVVVDLTPPEAPLVDAIASPTAADPVVVTGTAEPGCRVQVTADGNALDPAVVAGANGAWAFAATLANGSHAVTAMATDAAGNASRVPSNTVQVKVDRATPWKPNVSVKERTNADPVPVSGTADAGAVVTVYEGTKELGRAVVDAASRWSTTVALAEGAHALWAQALSGTGVLSAASDPATVVVDRTAPKVVSRAPAPGASNVWSRDPITVTFDEPIAPFDPVTSAAGVATLSVATGSAPALSAQLSLDGKVLTLVPGVLPAVPNRLSVTLGGGIRDLAGNALGAPDPWSWDVPAWQEFGPQMGTSVTAQLTAEMRSDDELVLMVHTSPGANVGTSSVTASGSSPVMGLGGTWTDESLALDSKGVIHVAYVPRTPGTGLHVLRQDASGGAVALGGALTAGMPYPVTIRVDAQDRPVVAWAEPAGSTYVVHTRRWNGNAWEAIGSGISISSTSPPLVALATAPGGSMSLAVASGASIVLYRLSLDAWAQVQNAFPLAASPSGLALGFDGDGAETIAYVVNGTGAVARWRTGIYPQFTALGGTVATSGRPRVLYRPAGFTGEQLLVAFGADVRGWDGRAWTAFGPDLGGSGDSGDTAAVSRGGVLSVAWSAMLTPGSVFRTVLVRRYNR